LLLFVFVGFPNFVQWECLFLYAKVTFVSEKTNICTKKVAFMDLSLADRAKIVAQYLSNKEGITQAQLGEKMGYSNRSAFSAVLNGLKTMPANFCERLASLDPVINPDFLSGKSDEMLRPESGQPAAPGLSTKQPGASGIYLPLELVKMFTDMSETIKSQQETISHLVGKRASGEKAI
jgi:hypothetical protein